MNLNSTKTHWANVHSHCNYCDGKGEMEEYAEEAVKKEFISYGYSSHAPLPFDCEWCMQISDLDEYVSHIEHLRQLYENKIQIYSGLEVDFIPDKIGPNSPFIKSLNLDFTIGSVHFIDTFSDGTPWEIDGLHTEFRKGLSEIYHDDIKVVMTRYFELTRQMVLDDCPTIVGHLDKIKIQNVDNKYYNEVEPWYIEEMTKTLKIIADSGTMVEVNTRGLYKHVADIYPSPWVIKKMHEMNIPVVLNSDSHHIREIDGQFSNAVYHLKQAGYERLNVLFDGGWQSYPFNEKGIEV